MNDDDFSGLVRSGSQHSVSVSEHTGNAKTPKNIVVSHEEETEARKRAFEQKALDALDAEKALAAALAEHTTHVAPGDGTTDANIQKVAANKEANNRQTVAGEAAAKPNVQNVSTDVLEANNQKVGTDKIQDNIQSVGSNNSIGANVQNVSADVMAANRQGVPTDVIASNQQNVGGGNVAANKQNIPGEKAIEANRQGIPTDVIAPNVQDISSKPLTANNPTIAQDAQGLNRQALGQDGNAKNQQGIPTDGINTHEQKLAKLGVQDNQQAIAQDSFDTNRQALAPAPSIAPNKQAIGTEAPSLNRQAAPQDAPSGINRQGIGNEAITSHFEPLPSGAVERKKVDFPTGSTNGTVNKATATPAAQRGGKPTAPSAAAVRPPITAAAQQEAKLKREQINDAFHGRLAGIKHNVDALNNRLSDFEEKVHKEDAHLIKGNPEDFDVKLD